jgi:hypothetical protein
MRGVRVRLAGLSLEQRQHFADSIGVSTEVLAAVMAAEPVTVELANKIEQQLDSNKDDVDI